jgi:hypothetical protein
MFCGGATLASSTGVSGLVRSTVQYGTITASGGQTGPEDFWHIYVILVEFIFDGETTNRRSRIDQDHDLP